MVKVKAVDTKSTIVTLNVLINRTFLDSSIDSKTLVYHELTDHRVQYSTFLWWSESVIFDVCNLQSNKSQNLPNKCQYLSM